MNTDIKAA